MNEQAPPEAQGRVFAVQMAIADLFSLPPLLVAGIAAGVVGERPTRIVAALGTMAVGLYLTFLRRWGPPPEARMAAPGPTPRRLRLLRWGGTSQHVVLCRRVVRRSQRNSI